jgi:hypothetical protein
MAVKKFDAVRVKRALQKEAEEKLSVLSDDEQLQLLAKKYGHLKNHKKVAHVA